MIRNFVVGVAWGGVVAGLGLAVVSQVAPQQSLPVESVAVGAAGVEQPKAEQPVAEQPVTVVPQAVVPDAPAEAVAAVAAAPETAAPALATPEISLPRPLEPAPLEPASTPASIVPEAEQTAPVIGEAPAEAAPLAGPLPQDEIALVVPEAAAPEALVQAPDGIVAPLAEADAAIAALPASEAGLAPAVAQGLPTVPAAELAPDAAELPAPAKPQTDEPLLDPAPVAEVPSAPAAIAPEPVEDDATIAEKPPSEITSLLPSTLAPDTGLNEPIEGVTTGRLPSIGGAAEPDAAVAEVAKTTPLERFARSFDNPQAKPLFAIVLLDSGAADLDRAQLAALPFPVSFVIDPLSAGASEAAAIYRGAGQEVLMLATGIPAGATAADLEQTFQAHADALPEAVAMVDLAVGGFQNDRPLSTQVVPILKAQGRGLLTFDVGLNAADQVARREDLPAATIFRSLDAEGEEAAVIRRYLDRAAFKAAQDGRVVVLGQTRPETIAALLEWTVEGRAASVALAPASAVVSVP